MKRCLLDCTLRDGGYLNNWNFGHKDIIHIFNALVESKVSFIEIGFLDDSYEFSMDHTINPNTECYNKIFEGVDKKGCRAVAMIDYGHCDIKNIELRDRSKTFIDFIRVIFKKDKMEAALKYVSEVQKLGYHVFAQMVSITSYTKRDLNRFINLANKYKPFAVSIVDTYGLLDKDILTFYYDHLDRKLDDNIRMGFHGHNNFQLAYANSLRFMEHIYKRNVLVDGTIMGMGKSAGNAPLETLMYSLNKLYGTDYDINPILGVIDDTILGYQKTMKWGYQLDFFVCGKNAVHPSYVSYYRKKGIDIRTIDRVLQNIDKDKALFFNEEYANELLNQ